MMRKIIVLSFTILIVCCIASCSNAPTSTQLETIKQEEYNLNATPLQHKAITFTEYNFGDHVFTASTGRDMPYTVRGTLAYPNEAGRYPLILITHGSHSNDDESLRFDTGFDYLVTSLAEQGYVVASMDMSKPYIWKYGDNDDREKSVAVAREHIRNLLLINNDELSIPNIELTNKIDTELIGLIGHSRGGETIHDIAIEERKHNVNIKSLLSLAPTQFFDRAWLSDIHSAIIVPEYDGDIISLDGYATFELLSAHNPSSVSVIQLLKANHNYFNQNIDRNDASFSSVEGATNDQLSSKQQQDFLVNFASDYFNHTLKEATGLFDYAQAQPNKLYNYEVALIYQHKQSLKIADSSTPMDTLSTSLSVNQKTDDWYYLDDEVIIDTVTYGDDKYKARPLTEIEWHDRNGILSIPISILDKAQYESISLRLVNNAASELTVKDMAQSFTIELTDHEDNKQRVVLPQNLNALSYYKGEIETTEIFDDIATFWSRPTPINMINVPFALFKNIDFNKIKEIKLIFDQLDQGSLYLESIWVN